MATVFISYDREHRDFAEVVQAKLERADHTTFMDLDILSAGVLWQETLEGAIRRSHAVVVVMTPEARQSEHVAFEWAYALGARVTVIPLELKETPFFSRLEALGRLDFRNGARPWDSLLAEVRKAEATRPQTGIEIEAGAPPAVKQAVRAVDSLRSEERVAAVGTLAEMEHPAACDALWWALQHPVRDVRIEAARLFPDRLEPCVVPGLIAALPQEGGWESHRSFVERMKAIGSPAVSLLLEALGQVRDGNRRSTILRGLGAAGDPSAVPILIGILCDLADHARVAAAETLGVLGDPAASTALLAALQDEYIHLRAAAAESLGSLKIAAAVPALITMLEEDDRAARRAAARALGEIGDPAAVPALIRTLEDHEEWVRRAAVAALGRMGDPTAIPHLRPLLQESEVGSIDQLDLAVMEALARLRDRESFGLIEEKLVRFRGGSPGVEPVCGALLTSGEEGIALVVRVLSNAADRSIREYAAQALRQIDTPEVAAALRQWRRQQAE